MKQRHRPASVRDSFRTPLGRFIKMRRQSLGLSQHDIDVSMGWGAEKQYLAKVESGQIRVPSLSIEEIARLAHILEAPVEEMQRAYEATKDGTLSENYHLPTLPAVNPRLLAPVFVALTPDQLREIAAAFEKIGVKKLDLSQVFEMARMLRLDVRSPETKE